MTLPQPRFCCTSECTEYTWHPYPRMQRRMSDLNPISVPPPRPQPPAAPSAAAAVNDSASQSAQAAGPQAKSDIRRFLQGRGSGKAADSSFAGLTVVCALSVIFIVLLIIFVLVSNSRMSIHAFGMKFFSSSTWDPVNGSFGALPFIYGTLVTSILATAIAVPLSVAVAIFVLDICPMPLRGVIAFLTELLAAIPSVVYGLWAVFVLVPIVRDQLGPVLERWFWLDRALHGTELRGGHSDCQHHSGDHDLPGDLPRSAAT